jgi:CheY-like chemotaxis protein
LLLVGALGCNPSADVKNETATRYLRNAIADPGGEVCGCALLLAPCESDSLSPSAKRALFLDRPPDTPIVLLLDRNEGFRSVMALGLEQANFRVIQARLAADARRFCQSHRVQILVADVNSLRPDPFQTLASIQETQPQIKVLLVSGYDQATVAFLYPGLLTGLEFLHKPFEPNVMANTAHWMISANKISEQPDVLAVAKTDTG